MGAAGKDGREAEAEGKRRGEGEATMEDGEREENKNEC